MLLDTPQNKEYLSSVAGLERAWREGRILEAPALLCDARMRLHVDLGCMHGYIEREEAVWCREGEQIKDIAVISRVGKPVAFKIIGFEKGKDGSTWAILSRKEAQRECMREYLMTLSCGDILDAKITHLEHFGAFVDIGCGIASLLSIDSISVSRISHPKDRFTSGMYIKAIIKSIDKELERIYVTHKELLCTWEENARSFAVGQTVVGIVRSVEEYGIFIELAPNLAGLAEYRENVNVGQSVAVYIKNIIPERMKIKLVIIDSCKGEAPRSGFEYYLSPDADHIDYWRYSPVGTGKIIESRFV
jgi:small subunit ribosomal protein S1